MPPLRLAILASLGLFGCPTPSDLPVGPPLAHAASLAADADWQRAVEIWQGAASIASSGKYPFDEAGQQRLFSAIEESRGLVQGLASRGLLTAAEAGLVQKDIDELRGLVGSKRPTELMDATCYEPMPYTPVRDSLERLEARLPLLERMAEDGTLHPEVVARVLERVEADLERLEDDAWLERHQDHSVPDLKPVRTTAGKARAAVDRIHARLASLEPKATLPEIEP